MSTHHHRHRHVTPVLPLLATLLLATLLLATGAPGCGDQGGPAGLDPGDPAVDATEVALQSVVKQFRVPRKLSDYALDLDGDGSVDNKLGQVANAIAQAAPGMDWATSLEQHFASGIASGSYLALVRVYGKSTALTTQPVAGVQVDLGKDRDGDPSDNFSGAEELGLWPSSPGTKIGGSIAAGALRAGPGELVVPLIGGSELLLVNLKLARVSGKVSPSGIVEGRLAGAIGRQEMESKLMPAFAAYFTESYQKTITDPKSKSMVRLLFDFDKNGVISASELEASIVGVALHPDVDTDDDGELDGVSVGFGFSSVPCRVVQ
jgi:hypothetical protein